MITVFNWMIPQADQCLATHKQLKHSVQDTCVIHIFIYVIVVALITISLFEKANIKLKLNAIAISVNHWMLLKCSSNACKLMETDWKIIHRIENCQIMVQYVKLSCFIAGICEMIMHGGVFLFNIT